MFQFTEVQHQIRYRLIYYNVIKVIIIIIFCNLCYQNYIRTILQKQHLHIVKRVFFLVYPEGVGSPANNSLSYHIFLKKRKIT